MADDPLMQALQSAAKADPLSDALKKAADKPEPTESRKLVYGFKSMPADIQNAAIWLESRFPARETEEDEQRLNSAVFPSKSRRQKYGADYYDISPDDRRKRILEYKDNQLAENYPDVHGTDYADSGTATAGKVAGAIASPTAMLPFGKTKVAAMLWGGGTAATDVALYGLAQEGEIDPVATGIGAVGGAVLAPAMLVLGRKIGAKLAQRQVKKTMGEAEQLMEMFQDGVNAERAAGTAGYEAIEKTAQKLGVNQDQVNKAMQLTNRRILMHAPEEAAEALSDIPPVGGFIKPQGFISQIIEPISSRISQISKPVFGRLREHEFNVHKGTHEAIETAEPFFQEVNALPKTTRKVVEKALLDGDFDIVEGAFKNNTKALKMFEDVQKVLRNSYDELVKVGYKDLTKIPNYFPRLIEDLDGLMGTLGKREQSLVNKALKQAESKVGRSLNAVETTDIVNKVVRGFRPREMPVRFSKKRQLESIPDHLLPFYANPRRSIHMYLRETINDVEKRKFFGRHINIKKGTNMVDLDNSIGAFVEEAVGNDPIAARELKNLLLARFYAGEQAPHRFIQTAKNLGYTTTLGNPFSAITQLGDLGVAVYMNGWKNTIMAIAGKKAVKAFDLGIIDAAKELSASPSVTAKVLEKALKYSGFNKLDQFGKDVLLNGAYRKYLKLAKSEKGRKAIEGKYGKVFGEELTSLVDDLRNKRMTDNVKLLLWNELSDVQPIALSEMPLKYLQNPNGRVFYMLKTFTIKQLDIIRRDAFREMRQGNIIKGTKNLAYFMTMFTSANMGTDVLKKWMMGQEIEADDVPDLVVANLMKNFAATEWIANQSAQGKLGTVLEDYMLPPLGVIDAIGSDLSKFIRGKDVKGESLRYMPLFGKVMYYWQGAGLEKYLKGKNKESDK